MIEGDTKTYILSGTIIVLLIVIWFLWKSSSRNYERANFAWKFLKAFNESIKDTTEDTEKNDTSTSNTKDSKR